jgi:hypothetical protein
MARQRGTRSARALKLGSKTNPKTLSPAPNSCRPEETTPNPRRWVMDFGQLMFHVADTNYGLCSSIGGASAPAANLTETDPKDKQVLNLRRSFEFCRSALACVDDSRLGEGVSFFWRKIDLARRWAHHVERRLERSLRRPGDLPALERHPAAYGTPAVKENIQRTFLLRSHPN